jgi:Zn-dependent protease
MPLAFLEGTFLSYAQSQPVYFVSWIVTVVVSVVLHELGHGIAAIRQGDDTPIVTGHMTLNPLVHMGGFSLIVLFLAGFAWGMMPVNPRRFRSRHGDAIVSIAGPAVNLVLALLAIAALGLWIRFAGRPTEGTVAANFALFLWVFGTANIVLCLLNLIPLPPLDGSRVVASFSRPYARLMADPNNQGIFFVALIGIFILGPRLFAVAREAVEAGVHLIGG